MCNKFVLINFYYFLYLNQNTKFNKRSFDILYLANCGKLSACTPPFISFRVSIRVRRKVRVRFSVRVSFRVRIIHVVKNSSWNGI